MRHFYFYVVLLVCGATACSDDTLPHYTLVIENSHADTTVRYTLTDTSIMVQTIAPLMGTAWSTGFEQIIENNRDTLLQISSMNPKAYDCKEQHALDATRVTFTNDSATFEVDPNVNHPKALDAAVRIFNRYLPATYHLEFIDMQSAIEPDGKMRL